MKKIVAAKKCKPLKKPSIGKLQAQIQESDLFHLPDQFCEQLPAQQMRQLFQWKQTEVGKLPALDA